MRNGSWPENNEAVAWVHVSSNQTALKMPSSHQPTYEAPRILRSSCQAVTCKAFLTVFQFWLWLEGGCGLRNWCGGQSALQHAACLTIGWHNTASHPGWTHVKLRRRKGTRDMEVLASSDLFSSSEGRWRGDEVQCPPLYWNSLQRNSKRRISHIAGGAMSLQQNPECEIEHRRPHLSVCSRHFSISAWIEQHHKTGA